MTDPRPGWVDNRPLPLSDTERALIEQQSFNFFTTTGRKMRLPPAYLESLRGMGVDVKWMEADASLNQ